MKTNTKFRMLKTTAILQFILVLISAMTAWSQNLSVMDSLEKDIKLEYERHQTDFIISLAYDLVYNGDKTGRTMIIDRTYKYKVKTISKPTYYAYGEGIVQPPPEFRVFFTSRSRAYTVYIKDTYIEITSQNLSFIGVYNIEKGEVKLTYRDSGGSFGKDGNFINIHMSIMAVLGIK